jgi:glycosyltransferase involved in cell wall biosynthesis
LTTDPKPRRSVFFRSVDSWACGWYRCYVPGVELQKLGYKVTMDDELRESDVMDNDVLVIQAPCLPEHLAGIRVAKGAGKLTVVDLDDDLWNLLPGNPAYGFWARPDTQYLLTACVQEADLLTTTTHYLAQRLSAHNPNAKVLGNMLPGDMWDYPEPKEQSAEKVVIGWAGSPSHVGDLALIDEAVRQTLDRYPHVEFVFMGGPQRPEIARHPRITLLPSTDIAGYGRTLGRFDIGLIPLADTAFNRCKSDLKFVEFSMVGIPSIVSKVEPYLRAVKHGENGFFASSAKDWLKTLARLIEDPELRRTVGTRAQEFARTRTIDKTVGRWEKAYGLTRPEV